MRKINLILLSIFVSSIFIIGCATANTGNSDTWRNVSSVNELIGKWEGASSVGIPENQEASIPQSSIKIIVSLEYKENSASINSVYKFDLDKLLSDMMKTDGMKQAGITKRKLWEVLVNEILSADEDGVFSDYGDFYMLLTEESGINDLSKCFINEKGNRLKIVFDEAIVFGLGDTWITEIILIKK